MSATANTFRQDVALNARWALLVLIALATMGTVMALQWTSQSEPQLFSMDWVLALVWTVSLAGWGLAALRALGAGAVGGVLRWATALGLGFGITALAILALGLAGWLNRWTSIALLAGGWAVVIARLIEDRAALKQYWMDAPRAAWLIALAGPVIGIALVGAMSMPGVLFPDEPAGYDATAYHLQIPREWFEAGQIIPLKHSSFSFFPMAMEVHYLLAMHLRGGPWAGMYLAQLMHAILSLATAAAVFGAVRSRGALLASTAALVVVAVPWVTMVGIVAYNEGALMLLTALAVAWAINDALPRRFVVAGVLAGLAAGVKYTGLPTLVVLLPVVLLAVQTIHRKWCAGPLYMLLIGLLVASPWLIRNAVWCGNPVFPLLTKQLGKAHWDDGQVERFNAAHAPREDQRSAGARLSALGQQVLTDYRWGTPMLIDRPAFASASIEKIPLAFSPLVLLVALALVTGIRSKQVHVVTLLLLSLTVYWLMATHLQGRFFLQAIPLLAMLAALSGWRPGAAVGLLVAVTCAVQLRLPAEQIAGTTRGVVEADLADIVKEFILPGTPGKVVFDTDRPIVFAGDAQIFLYPLPMSRVQYRYVFDVPSTGDDAVKTWVDQPRDGAAVIVNPSELRRFSKTYRNLPPLPERVQRAEGSYLVSPSR
jgi:hypothetical protein